MGVGSWVGVGVGSWVGVGVGSWVGVGVGSWIGVGVLVGAGMAAGVGVTVGIGIGSDLAVGLGTGVGVGVAVGTDDGVAVGVAVRVGVGVAVGVRVAIAVAVGTDVGVAVGLGRILATGEGVGSSEHPARSTATSIRATTSQIMIGLGILGCSTICQRLRTEGGCVNVDDLGSARCFEILGAGESLLILCARSRWNADRVAEVTAIRAAATAVSVPSMTGIPPLPVQVISPLA